VFDGLILGLTGRGSMSDGACSSELALMFAYMALGGPGRIAWLCQWFVICGGLFRCDICCWVCVYFVWTVFDLVMRWLFVFLVVCCL